MKNNTRAPWLPMLVEWWPSIAQTLTESGVEWPRDAARADLRWWDDQVRMERERRIPGRPTLRARWGGWTDHQVRSLLRDEAAWKDPRHMESPAHRQPVASASPETAPILDVECERVASPSPARRQPISTRADLHTTQEHKNTNNPPTPLQGDDSGDEAEQASKPTPKKRRTRKPAPEWLTVEDACAVEIPSELLALDGYSEAARAFLEHRILNVPKGGATTRAVELVHGTMLKSLKAGVDADTLIETFHKSIMSNWTGVFPPKAPRKSYGAAATPDCPLADSRTAWEQALGGLRQTDGHQTPGDVSGWWLYRADSRAHDALAAALVEATGCGSFSLAWRHLRLCEQFEQNRIMGAFRRCWATHWGKHAAEPQTDCLDRANSRTATAQAAEQVAA
jgi:hypothetical protein